MLAEKTPALVELFLCFFNRDYRTTEQFSFENFHCLTSLGLDCVVSTVIVPPTIRTLFLKRLGTGAEFIYRDPMKIKKVTLHHVYDMVVMDAVMAGVCAMRNLESLTIDWCMVLAQHHIDALANLPNLRSLNICAHDEINLQRLQTLEELFVMELAETSFEFIYGLQRLARLQAIMFSSCTISHTLLHSFLRGMPQLREVTLRDCPYVEIDAARSSFPNLKICH